MHGLARLQVSLRATQVRLVVVDLVCFDVHCQVIVYTRDAAVSMAVNKLVNELVRAGLIAYPSCVCIEPWSLLLQQHQRQTQQADLGRDR